MAVARQYLMPSDTDITLAKETGRVLATQAGQADVLHLRLDNGMEVFLPPVALRVLIDALGQLAQGNAITLMPIDAELTTQQAAELINVSRTFFVDELLEKGAIPFRKVGVRRRVLFKDVMDYKLRLDAARLETLAKMVEHDQQYEQYGYGL
jgi:excisionase family DNA binding protein